MCQLYHAVQNLIDKHDHKKIAIISPKILIEWKNIFISDIQNGILDPLCSIQLGAYHILKHVVPKLVEQDKNTIELKNFNISTMNIKKLEEVLQSAMNAILMKFKLYDTVTFPPHSDTYIYTIGYLVSWAIILDMCANAYEDLLHIYAEILKDNVSIYLPTFTNLLNNIFRLMPL